MSDNAADARALADALSAIGLDEVGGEAFVAALGAAGERAEALADPVTESGDDVALLARACARCIALMRAGELIVELTMPYLVAAVDTLRRAIEGNADQRPGDRAADVALRAARYELETLFPVPGAPGAGAPARAPDVPVGALTGRNARSAPE